MPINQICWTILLTEDGLFEKKVNEDPGDPLEEAKDKNDLD